MLVPFRLNAMQRVNVHYRYTAYSTCTLYMGCWYKRPDIKSPKNKRPKQQKA